MSISAIIFILLALGLIISGILLLKHSAKKFKLTPEQQEKINKRNALLDKEEQNND
ncbi:MAG: DUF2897 family protein [Alteromonadales bacterium]|nr:DUF2897 family protein [Alteromonadales bacterium]